MVESSDSPYKYSCRKCPIRDRCIDYSDSAPTIKAQIRNAFANKTDTINLWAHLQTQCLLVKADEEAKKGTTESLLSRRLRRARQANEQKASAAPNTPPVEPPPKPVPPPVEDTPAPVKTGIFPRTIRPQTGPFFRDTGSLRTNKRRYWFTVPVSGRHIGLPVDGSIVLGRFDPSFGIPPDVDLTLEDQAHDSVSRRHARISGKDGIHFAEEMGSRAGIIINGKKLPVGASKQLHEGDTVELGALILRYGIMPSWVMQLKRYPNIEHTLIMSATGDRWILPSDAPLIIGRSDRFVNFNADIDLSIVGQLASKVSRRHALLNFQPEIAGWLIEDMGSGFGTKVNGELVMPGRQRTLIPGDHIWLGGCVLAYDVNTK